MDTQKSSGLNYDHAATYRIWVRGLLGPSWSKRLLGLAVRTIQLPGEPPATMLEGELPDQAALIGVLLTLHELHLPLLSIECTSADKPPAAAIL